MVPDRARELLAAASVVGSAELAKTADVSNVVIVAQDERRIVAEALAGLGDLSPRLPVVAATGSLPSFLGPRTVALVLSDHDDVLAGGLRAAAHERGAALVGIGTSAAAATAPGGLEVALVAEGDRLGLTTVLVAALLVLERLGLVGACAAAVEAAHAQLVRRAAREAAAVELARRIGRGFPLVLGVEGIGAAAAEAFRAEYNLRLKSPALAGSLPAASYVDVAGFGLSGDVTRQLITIVRLAHDFEPEEVARRGEVALELVAETVADELRVEAEGDGPLAQCCDLVLVGEQVARAAAAREGVDADAVPVLAELERVGRASAAPRRG